MQTYQFNVQVSVGGAVISGKRTIVAQSEAKAIEALQNLPNVVSVGSQCK